MTTGLNPASSGEIQTAESAGVSLISRRLRRIGLFSTGSRLTQLAVRALAVPLSISLLGTDTYGYWLAVGSVTAWFTVSDLGIGQLALSQLAEQVGHNDLEGARKVLYFARILYALLAVVLFGLFTIAYFASTSSRVLVGPRNLVPSPQIDTCFLIVGLSLALTTGLNLAPIVNHALLKTERNYVANTISPLLSLLVLFSLRALHIPLSLAAYACVMCMPSVLSAVGLFLYTFSVESRFKTKPHEKQGFSVKGLLSSSASLIIIQLCDLVIYYTPIVYVTRVLGPSAAATYGVTASIFMIGVNLCFGWGHPHIAAYTMEARRKNYRWITGQHRSLLIRTSASFLCGALFLILAGQFLIKLYTGNRLIVPQHLIVWLALFYGLLVLSQQNGFLLLGVGMEKLRAGIQILNAISLIAGLYAFGRTSMFSLIFPFVCISLGVDFVITIRAIRGRLSPWRPAQTSSVTAL